MKFLCEICGSVFTDMGECARHEDEHKNDIIWRQVHLRREGGRWGFTFSDIRKGSLPSDVPYDDRIYRSVASNKDWPVWWAACRNTKDAIDATKRKLMDAAMQWYREQAGEIEKMGENK